jgi:hypothetical protein
MKVLFAIAAVAALTTGGVASADCTYPTPPGKIPDGRTATLDEMVTAQKAVKDYDKAIKAYTDCLKLEHDDVVGKIGDKPTPEQKKALADMERVQTQKNNAAVDQEQSVVDRFNEQIRIFKEKQKNK